MTYNFDEFPDRRKSDCIKWHAHEEDILPMWVADMDVISPEPIIRALHDRVSHGVFGYPRVMPELEEIIVERLADLYQWHIQPEDIVLTPGVVKGFNLACQVTAEPGGGVLVNPPIYHPILFAPKNADMYRQDVELTLKDDGSYQIDWTAFESAISDQTCLFILSCSYCATLTTRWAGYSNKTNCHAWQRFVCSTISRFVQMKSTAI